MKFQILSLLSIKTCLTQINTTLVNQVNNKSPVDDLGVLLAVLSSVVIGDDVDIGTGIYKKFYFIKHEADYANILLNKDTNLPVSSVLKFSLNSFLSWKLLNKILDINKNVSSTLRFTGGEHLRYSDGNFRG